MAKISEYGKIVLIGGTFLLPFYALIKSVGLLGGLQECDEAQKCIFGKMFTDRVLPSGGNVYFLVQNGISNAWLQSKGRSPLCSGYSKAQMITACKLVPKSDVQNVLIHNPSTISFLISLPSWGISRIVHDGLLIGGWSHVLTIKVSMVSTFFLAVSATSSVLVCWSYAELFYAPIDDGCGCFFRFGFLTAAGLLSIPIVLCLHMLANIDDGWRAMVGGDYLITMKFHLAHRFKDLRGLTATGSVLGMPGFGTGCTQSPNVPNLAQGAREFYDMLCSCAILAVVVAWLLAFPYLAMRFIQVAFGVTLIWLCQVVGFLLLVVCFFVFAPHFGGMCEVLAVLPCSNIAGFFSQHFYLRQLLRARPAQEFKFNRVDYLEAALLSCPECADEQRLLEMAEGPLNASWRTDLKSAFASAKDRGLSSPLLSPAA